MTDYIDREAFKAEIRRLSTHYLNEWDTLGVLAAADRIPAADVRPVVKAHWIPTGEAEEIYGDVYKCSACGCCDIGEVDFCANCGAKMEES